MEDELVTSSPPGVNGDAPESDQAEQSDGLLTQDKEELSERVAHLEKRIREQQDEISCLKGAMADLMRRVGHVETSKKNIRLLPMKPNLPSSVRAPVTAFPGRQSDSISVNGKDQLNSQSMVGTSSVSIGQTDASLSSSSSLKSDYLSKFSSAQNSVLPSKPFVQSPRRTPSGKERTKSATSAPTSARQPPRGSSASSVKKWNSMSNSIDDVTGQKTSKSSSQLTSSNKQQEKGPSYDEEDECGRNVVTLKGRNIPLWYYGTRYSDSDLKRSEHEPEESLKLDWVYGYRGRDARNNLFELSSGEIVYFQAAVVVLFNINDEYSQRHYLEHTDDIKCLAVHPDKIRIATGQVAGHEKKQGKPHVRIWHSITLCTVAIIGEHDFQRAVACVAFSDDYKMLVVDESNEHVLSVWDIKGVPIDSEGEKKALSKRAKKLMEVKSSGDPVTQCEFHPLIPDLIVCCGKSQISFFTPENNTLDKKNGIFGKYDKPKVVICFAIHPETGDVISGDSSGNIYVWEKGGNRIKNAVEGAHEGPIFSICILKDNTILSGGGKDRKIIQWNQDLEKTGKEVQVEEQYGAVRMISEGNGRILVGTIRNCILQITIDFNKLSPVTEGHKEELWGLCEIPDSTQFLTCGYDSHVYLWDAQKHSVLWMMEINLENPAHCCAVYDYGDKLLAVLGHRKKGAITLMDLSSKEKLGIFFPSTDHENGKYEQHECVEFSPDGAYVALGNRDNYIYVFEVQDKRRLHKVARCKGHSSFVTHIDWSVKSDVIRSNSGDYSILYWDAKTGKQLTRPSEVDFVTNNCTLSFNTGGIWPEGADGTDINNCSISHDRSLIATADDFGKVNLYNYPCLKPRAPGKSYKGHSSHVTMAKFLAGDRYLITTGGRDMSVLQWKVCK